LLEGPTVDISDFIRMSSSEGFLNEGVGRSNLLDSRLGQCKIDEGLHDRQGHSDEQISRRIVVPDQDHDGVSRVNDTPLTAIRDCGDSDAGAAQNGLRRFN
jgi:hypothetical protein